MERSRVLVVDDKQDNAEALGSLLHHAGYEIFVETNGAQALSLARAERPDALLLDLQLPGLSGFELCRQLKAEPWGNEVLVIAITGWTRDSDKAKALAAGFDYYLLKPAELETLDALLKGVDRRGSKGSRLQA